MSDETYYSVLEIQEAATPAEIKAAYHRLIREVHPDRLANASAYWQRQAAEKAQEVNEAFAVLSNTEKRRVYDAQLAAFRKSQTPNHEVPAHPTNPAPSPTAQQHSPKPPNRSGFNSQSTPQSRSQQHGASTSTQPPNSPSTSGSQRVPTPMLTGDRFVLASICAFFGFGAAGVYWESSTIGEQVFPFLLAMVLFGGVAFLYRHRIRPLLVRLRLTQPNQQVWATIGVIALALIVGNIASMKPENIGPDFMLGAAVVLTALAYLYRSQIRSQLIRLRSGHLKSKAWLISIIANIAVVTVILIGTAKRNRASAPVAGSPNPLSAANQPNKRQIDGGTESAAPETTSYSPSEGNDPLGLFGVTPGPKPKDRENPSGRLKIQEVSHSRLEKHHAPKQISQQWQPVDNGSKDPLHLASSTKQVESSSHSRSAATPAVRTPVTNRASTPSSTKNHESPDLSGLSISDRGSIQTACSLAYGQGPASYHRCLNDQLAKLAANPEPPDLSGLSISDRGSIQTACSLAYGQGPVTYHRCLRRQLAELATDPKSPDLSGLSLSDRGSIQTACSLAYGQGPATYHRCLLRQLAALGSQ